MLKPKKILVPTDFSEYSDKALQQGIDIARHYNSTVYLYHVIQFELRHIVVDYAIPIEVIDAVEKEQVSAAIENMKKQLARCSKTEGVEVAMELGKGVAYEEILSKEKEKGIDLIVIASLGSTGLAKYIVGSVSRNVLKNAVCPVLLTK